MLGLRFELGDGVSKDYLQAFRWYQRAAEQNYPVAQYRLGLCYELGRGVERNYENAVAWYVKPQSRGQPDAQNASVGAMPMALGAAGPQARRAVLVLCRQGGRKTIWASASARSWRGHDQGCAVSRESAFVCANQPGRVRENGYGVAQQGGGAALVHEPGGATHWRKLPRLVLRAWQGHWRLPAFQWYSRPRSGRHQRTEQLGVL